jgi:NADPH:quinone reductase-like Zn-dependent oxidoreductase
VLTGVRANRHVSPDAAGTDVPESRIGERVWVFGAQSYRPFGAAAQLTVVSELAAPDDAILAAAAAGQSN